MRITASILIALVCGWDINLAAAPADYFEIRIVDEQSDRGVPLVELETVSHLVQISDSAGRVAFNEPGLMNRKVFFYVRSHGYDFPKDGFGFAGGALDVKPGGSATLKLKRFNIAERLYRTTGEGIYRDTVLLGHKAPIAEPVINALVLGQDSTQCAVYRGKIFWFWGDTLRARYPLGHYQTSGATSELPGKGGLDPAVGVDLKYFKDDEGFSKRMVPFKEEGVVWLDGLLTVADEAGRERLVAHYSRRKGLADQLEHGLVIYNDEREEFERFTELQTENTWRHPRGHAVRVKENAREYFAFATPFCSVRVPATLADLKNPASYEAFTCLPAGGNFRDAESALERDLGGKLVWAWKRDTAPVAQEEENAFVRTGKIKPAEVRFQIVDAESKKPVTLHTASVRLNEFRKRWVMIAVEQGGKSFLGEIWYLESDSPAGPWSEAKKVVTHNRYTFYNPVHHPFLDQQGGRFIFFEGTYTAEFSGNPGHTPRYDYNQIMYRLDLVDERLRQISVRYHAQD